jgi:hypothetical protein
MCVERERLRERERERERERAIGRERGRECAGERGKERVKRRGDERTAQNTRQREYETHAMTMGAARMHKKITYHNTQDARREDERQRASAGRDYDQEVHPQR